MRVQPVPVSQNRRIVAGLPFVESLARRMAASMPNSIDIGDLVQDGVLGLIDAANRFDEKRLSRTIVRINTIEATSPLNTGEHMDESSLPTALVPSEPESPDAAYERCETRDRVRAAIQS